jgi:uncharacterized protein (TIGR03083 family)
MPPLGEIDYLTHLRADSARFAEVLGAADPALPVPTCPGWTASDLLWHLAEVQLFWATIVERRLADPGPADAAQPDRPQGHDELVDLVRTAGGRLVAALEATPKDTPIWTWFENDRSAGFAYRRQAHEAVIHRLDAEHTTGQVTDVDAELATDGVAEVFDCMYSTVPGWAEVASPGPVGRVTTTDTGAEWLVQVGSWSGTSPRTGTSYTDEGSLRLVALGAPAFSVSGAARDLDAWLWNRPAREEIQLAGDYERFAAIIRAGVQ